jgi:hypothetical protein
LQEQRIDIEQKRIEIELRKLKLLLRGSRRSKSKRESPIAGDEHGLEDYDGGMTTPDDDDYDHDDDVDEDSVDDDDLNEKKDRVQSKRRSSTPKRDRDGSTHVSSQRSRKGLEGGSTDDAPSIHSRTSKSVRGMRRNAFDPDSVSSNDAPPVPSRSTGSKSVRGMRRSAVDPPHIDAEVPPSANSGTRTKTKVPVLDNRNADILYEVTSESTQRRRMERRGSAPAVSSFNFDISNMAIGPVRELTRKQASMSELDATTTTTTGSAVPTGDMQRARMQESIASMDDMSVQTEKHSNKK